METSAETAMLPPFLNLSVKKGANGPKPKREIKRMTNEQMDSISSVASDRRGHRANAFYGNDEEVSNLGPINPLGFLPIPPKSASGEFVPNKTTNCNDKILSFPKKLHVFYSETQGRRPSMEDQLFIASISIGNDASVDLVAIFDGHNGPLVPNFLKETMVPIFEKHFKIHLFKVKNSACDSELPPLDEVFKKTFAEANQNVREYNIFGGSTALFLLLHEDKIYFANTGDCRAVISHQSLAKRITIDHKPDLPKERARLEALGATITKQTMQSGKEIFRLEGILGLSRSFGDFQLDPYISADPDVFVINASELDSEFIVMACDGLWDEISDQDSVKIVKGHLKASPDDWEGACNRLRNASYASGSTDNISCIIIHNGTANYTEECCEPVVIPTKSPANKWNRNSVVIPKIGFDDDNDDLKSKGANCNDKPKQSISNPNLGSRVRSISEIVSPRKITHEQQQTQVEGENGEPVAKSVSPRNTSKSISQGSSPYSPNPLSGRASHNLSSSSPAMSMFKISSADKVKKDKEEKEGQATVESPTSEEKRKPRKSKSEFKGEKSPSSPKDKKDKSPKSESRSSRTSSNAPRLKIEISTSESSTDSVDTKRRRSSAVLGANRIRIANEQAEKEEREERERVLREKEEKEREEKEREKEKLQTEKGSESHEKAEDDSDEQDYDSENSGETPKDRLEREEREREEKERDLLNFLG